MRTVLVVEDRPEDRMLVRRLLRDQRRSYAIVEATTGDEALARFREAPPDCVVLDYNLPDTDGEEFLAALGRAAGHALPVPVVVLTGHEDDGAASRALHRGAQDYLLKDGLSSHALVRAIENAVEKHAIRRELEAQRAAVELRNHRLEALRDELQERMLELADATRAKDRFLAVMSHEMRTPLNAILGYTELLDMQLDGALTDSQRRQLERIRVGSRHLLDLTNDVLDLTRADARKLELDLRPVDLGAVLEEVSAMLERQAAEKGIALAVEPCDASLPLVHADLQRLRQVLTNLVGNAVKFTDEGEVRVRCRVGEGERVHVAVEDTGLGIDPDVLPLIFNEFYQAQGDLTRRHGGSGLGLAISQRLARLMGAEIAVRSEPGVGSTFTLVLRTAPEGSERRPADVTQHAERMAAHAAAGPHEAVTVVAFGRDAASLAELERRVRPGVRLRWTTEQGAVSALAVEARASLVVLDAGSADGAAWQAAAALQGVPELAETAVLLLPSIPAALPDEAPAMLDLGWISLVPKPFSAEQLTRAVSVAADSTRGDVREAADLRIDAAEGCEVLVVDDDADSRRVASRFLASAGVAVREAPDGESALVEMRLRPPDVVVLDLMMPVLDGFGVLAAMRADPALAAIPVVVLTAKSLTEAERQFLSRTAARVLQKGAHRLADVASLVLRAASRTASGRSP